MPSSLEAGGGHFIIEHAKSSLSTSWWTPVTFSIATAGNLQQLQSRLIEIAENERKRNQPPQRQNRDTGDYS